RGEDLVDVPRVVVPGDDEQARRSVRSRVSIREPGPAAHVVAHDLAEELLLARWVAAAPCDFRPGRDPRVVAVEANRGDELVELLPFAHVAFVAKKLRPEPSVVPPLDRNDRLADQVSAHDR